MKKPALPAPAAPIDRRLARAGLVAAILGGMLLFWPGEPASRIAPKLAAMSAGLAVAWWGVRRARATPLDPAIAALFLAAAASTVFSVDRPLSVLGDLIQANDGLLDLALYACAFWLGAAGDDELSASGQRAVVFGGALMGVYCLLQFAGIAPMPAHGRATATVAGPISAGACLAMAFPIALSEAFSATALGAAAAPLIAIGLALTGTRSAWLAAFAGAAACLACGGKMRSPRARRALGFGAVATTAATLAVTALRPGSDVMRVEIWRAALAALARRPLLGYGPDSFSIAFRFHKSLAYLAAAHSAGADNIEAHNDLLQAGVTLGLAGLAAYVLAQAALIAAVWPKWDGGARRSAAVGSLVAVAFFAKVNPVAVETLVICAWIAGTLAASDRTAAAGRRALLAYGSAALAAVFATLWFADLSCGRAENATRAGRLAEAREAIDAATTFAPGRLEYVVRSCEIAVAQAKRAAMPEVEKRLTLSLIKTAQAAARNHFGNPQAHELYGTAQLFAAGTLGPELLQGAKAELELASALDPTHSYPIQRRMQIAQAMNDKEAYRKAAEELARLPAVANIPAPD